MGWVMRAISGVGLTAKMISLCCLFGLVPMAVVGGIAYHASQQMESEVGIRFQTAAQNVADKIDRNLFERYGDVQAFGLNRVVLNRSDWYKQSEETSDLVRAINQYVDTYDVYSLSMVVDLDGKVVAVNSRDWDGKPINATSIYKKDYLSASWLQALKAGRFTTTMPFSGPGNSLATGTVIEDLYIDQEVKAAYPGDDGLTIGFSAPVSYDGKVIAYWHNRTRFSVVEDIVRTAYGELSAAGYSKAELTLLDGSGRIIVNYDPSGAGTDKIQHNLDELLKFNMVEAGSPPARAVVAGGTGYGSSTHIRKKIEQTHGYAHLRGALGYPGMNWSVLVRVPQEQAAADAWVIQRNVLFSALACLAVILASGFFIGRHSGLTFRRMADAARAMASGNYDARVKINSQDEIGQLGTSFNHMAEQIGTQILQQREAHTVMARLKTAIENAAVNVMIVDAEEQVIFLNRAAQASLMRVEGDLKRELPGFAVDKIVGGSISQYHAYVGAIRDLLRTLGPGTVRDGYVTPGSSIYSYQVRAIFDEREQKIGYLVEWHDVTTKKKAQDGLDRLISAATKGQLSERMKAEELDGYSKVLAEGANQMLQAVAAPLGEAQAVFSALAQGDLTQRMAGTYQGEFATMKTTINTALQNLSETLTAVRDVAENVTTATEEIASGSEDLAQRTSEEAGALEETSASMEEMTATVKQNADNAKQANQLAIAAREVAVKGGDVTTRAVDAMGEINKSSKRIADIITVIDEIAFQTNLLALNAAVEAARAGEHGRGFAVVATEVRNLAQRSATAAREIKGLINESIQRVTEGSELVNQSGDTLQEIMTSVQRVTDIIGEITAASQEQALGIEQVSKAIVQMDDSTQQNAALVEETSSASQSMKDQAQELMQRVATFKLAQASGPSAHVAKPMAGPVKREALSVKRGGAASGKNAASRETTHAAKEPVGVASGNGKDRRQQDSHFEEF